ncbi:MAG: radical SAM protein [Brevinematales bacterium]|nr:radical SAM protein [Brevinematales bacterium]
MYQKVKLFAKKDTLSFVLSEEEFVILDYEGRLNLVFNKGIMYRRGYDNIIVCSKTNNTNYYETIPNNQKTRIIDRYYTKIKEIIDKSLFDIMLLETNNQILRYTLEKIKALNSNALEEDGKKFRSIFKPITIIPPENYLSLYIPITEGCSYNKCSFCNLYKDRSFRIKNPTEIDKLMKDIIDFFGLSLLTRKSIFLGEGNVIVENNQTILQSIQIIKEHLSKTKHISFNFEDSFYGFMDTFHTKKTIKELEELKKAGIRKVYIGLETGDDELIAKILLKPSTSKETIQVVNNLKSVGINVGIIIIVGIGGKKYKNSHFDKTIQTISEMNLDSQDTVFLSPLIEYSNLDYSRIINELGIERMSKDEIHQELKRFKEALTKIKKLKTPIYKVDRFLYA